MDFLTIGIDIGGTNFRIGAVNGKGEITGFEKNSSRIFDSGDVIEIMADEIEMYMKRYGITENVRAVGVGIPSMVSKDKKRIVSTPNLKGFDNLDFVDRLEEKIEMPVFLDRDVNFLLQNDISCLKLDASKTILGFYVGTGFGNAISTGAFIPVKTALPASSDTFRFSTSPNNAPAEISGAVRSDARASIWRIFARSISPTH